ncbi:MAG: cytochrome c [Nitrosomonadales bacterium]|nr:cytochrome c [Nitrosomonadales bacterium]
MATALLAAVSVAAYGGLPGLAQAAASAVPQTITPAQLEAGRKIYNFRCYFCHGYSGNAQTVAASFLKPPPADFTAPQSARFTPEHIVSVLRNGKPGTAMPSFRNVISDTEMELAAAFVADEFVLRKAPNTHYHTAENGWPDHRRYRAAFPFATGEIPMSRPWEELSEEQARGKRLFLNGCVTCHDRGGSREGGRAIWEARPLSYPRNNFSFTPLPKLDAIAGASPYALHDMPLKIKDMTPLDRRGQKLWQDNCAFCHATDGTGKNWIGSFLEPHARNLRDPDFMGSMTRARLKEAIREGLPGTSMPAWKSVLADKEIAALVAYIAKAFHPLPE